MLGCILRDVQKRLNLNKVNQAIAAAGFTQTAIAEALEVSKEAVSQWLNEKSFPRPNKLLQLGKLLNLGFDELVILNDPYLPKVAFRKTGNAKTKDHHIKKAQEMGRFMRHLAPFLPFDTLEMPPVLKSPRCDYEYLCKVTAKVRRDVNLNTIETVDFIHLIRRFRELQATIVPVLWGNKQRHENAVHIFLPDSQTTWVYLNLDTNIHDFKFWMAHELGHCLSPSLSVDDAEDFADAFAGALLFPHELAQQAYTTINKQHSGVAGIAQIISIAEEQVISPYTIMGQVNKFARHSGEPEIELGGTFGAAVTNFNKNYQNLSEALFGDISGLHAREYIAKAEQLFETPFFDLLRQYFKQNDKGPGIVHAVMDIPLPDAWGIHSALT